MIARSHAHISKGTEYLGLLLVLLHVLAERTMAAFHVGKFVLILDEEAAAIFAHSYRHIRHHVLEVSFRGILTEVAHILYEHLLESHASHHFLVHVDRLIVLGGGLVLRVLQEALSEKVVFDALVMVVHREDLLLLADVLAPTTSATASTACRWIHPEQFFDAHRWNARVRYEFNQGQRVKAAKVSDDRVSTGHTPVAPIVRQRVHVDAPITGHG